MKNIILITGVLIMIVISIIFSCSDETDFRSLNEERTTNYPQIWTLVKMTGSMVGSETTGSDMAWQEEYILNSNDNFIKRRIIEGETIEITGIYEIDQIEGETFLNLTYTSNHEILGNCTGDATEYLKLKNNVLLSSWNACDGPGLEYKRLW